MRKQSSMNGSADNDANGADGGGGGGGGDGGGDDESESDGEDQNPLLHILGISQGPNPGMRVALEVTLYPLAPSPFMDVVTWQQRLGWLPKCSLQAASCLPAANRSLT
jgi:hypothetical protein